MSLFSIRGGVPKLPGPPVPGLVLDLQPPLGGRVKEQVSAHSPQPSGPSPAPASQGEGEFVKKMKLKKGCGVDKGVSRGAT